MSPLPRREARTIEERDLEDRRRMIGPTLGGSSGIVAPVNRRMPTPKSGRGGGGPAIKYIQDDQPGTMKPRELWLDTDEPAPEAAPSGIATAIIGQAIYVDDRVPYSFSSGPSSFADPEIGGYGTYAGMLTWDSGANQLEVAADGWYSFGWQVVVNFDTGEAADGCRAQIEVAIDPFSIGIGCQAFGEWFTGRESSKFARMWVQTRPALLAAGDGITCQVWHAAAATPVVTESTLYATHHSA